MHAPAAKKKKRDRNFVSVGQVKIRWSKSADGRTFIDPRKYGRKIATFRDHDEAIREANRIALEIHTGGVEVLALTAADRAAFAKAKAEAEKHGSDLTHAMVEWSAAKAAIAGHSMAAVIEAGLTALNRPAYSTVFVCREFLEVMERKVRDKRQRGQTRNMLRVFTADFPGEMRAILQPQIETWLNNRRKRDGSKLAPKTRSHWRAAVVQLFKFARDRGYLPDVKTEAAKVQRDDSRKRHVCGIFKPEEYRELRDRGMYVAGIFTPGDVDLILRHVDPEDVPWIALNGFSGARVEEIGRSRHARDDKDWIRWEDFDWTPIKDKNAWHVAELIIRSEVSKTGKLRRIPVSKNLAEILAPYRDRRGLVVPTDVDRRREKVKARLTQLAKVSDEFRGRVMDWPENALRHSYGSYRMAITHNLPQLAYEMGNSISMVQTHYHNPRPRDEGEAWFSVVRSSGQKLIQLDFKAIRAKAR